VRGVVSEAQLYEIEVAADNKSGKPRSSQLSAFLELRLEKQQPNNTETATQSKEKGRLNRDHSGVSPVDPIVFLVVAAILALVTLGASLVPAILGAKSNPVDAHSKPKIAE
jgi:hypothetical protein